MWPPPHEIDTSRDARAVTFENPIGARGAGGTVAGGRKGAPSKRIEPGERVVLADVEGPGIVRHIWMTFPPAPPETMRAMVLEVFYDGAEEPSISAPCLDLFGLPHGRPTPYASMLTTAQEGRGFNCFIPIPFGDRIRIEFTNHADRATMLFYQVDLTLEAAHDSYLHVSFRRENPTTLKQDFTVSEGLRGPGRFLGCVVGVRTIDDGIWYGEGEVKIFRDGDADLPTICGTGLEDYVGTAWGMGAHHAPFAGAPLDVRADGAGMPDFVGFYRWHVPDPVCFTDEMRVTIQQIGYHVLTAEDDYERYVATNPPAGGGPRMGGRVHAQGIFERRDDYCATDFVYCREPQAVPRVDVAAALTDIARRDHEQPLPMERLLSG